MNANNKWKIAIGTWEFADEAVEKAYFTEELKNTLSYLRPIILIMGVLYLLFIIPDYFVLTNQNFSLILVNRLVFLGYFVFLYWKSKNFEKVESYYFWITTTEILAVLFFHSVFIMYKPANFLIQGFGVMIILQAFFFVPNKFKNVLLVSLLTVALFLLTAFYVIEGLVLMEFIAVTVYLLLVLVMSSITFLRTNYYKRKQYANSQAYLHLSITDHLTSVYNRQKFNAELKKAFYSFQNYNRPFSAILLDIDDFKSINDRYGHLKGDKVLVEVSGKIDQAIRSTDILARWGGEEFIILLPDTQLEEAIEIAERLRNLILKSNFAGVAIHCSFGAASLEPGETEEDFLNRVDGLLYEAKRKGKNQVSY